jgi:hypothetical protein
MYDDGRSVFPRGEADGYQVYPAQSGPYPANAIEDYQGNVKCKEENVDRLEHFQDVSTFLLPLIWPGNKWVQFLKALRKVVGSA